MDENVEALPQEGQDTGKLGENLDEKYSSEWAKYWDKEIKAAEKWMRDFHDTGATIYSRYIGSQSDDQSPDIESRTKFNIFWSNVQVILAAIFARPPQAEVDRAHMDPNDDVARVAATILQRIFEEQFKLPDTSPLDAMHDAIIDRFIVGMGILWVRYSFTSKMHDIPAVNDPMSGVELSPAAQIEVVVDEQAPLDYVHWDDFLISPCRRWQEKRWVARAHYMTKAQLKEKFGELAAEEIPLTGKSKKTAATSPIKASPRDTALVYEIWDVESRRVYWKANGSDTVVEIQDDPLKLRMFFPCAQPIRATYTTESFLPTPDYMMVRGQYVELEMIAERLTLLTEALRVVGIYDKASEELKSVLSRAGNNQMIPVDNWAMFAEKGGVKGSIDWFPLEQVTIAIEKLTQRKQAVLQELYEVLGIADIMRGMSAASETATAQELKARFGSARVTATQNSLTEFLTGAMWLMLEVVAKHWSPETIVRVSQIMNTVDAQFAEQAVMSLKQDQSMVYRLQINTDSTASPNWNEEKTQRSEFLQAVSQFIGMCMPLIDKTPSVAPFLVQILQWAATGFKAAKQIEGVFDQALIAIQKDLATPKPPPPLTPEDLKDLSSADQNASAAIKGRFESAVLAKEAGLSPQIPMQIPPPSTRVGQPAGPPQQQPPRQQGASGPAPQPPGAPTQAGPMPPR